MPSTGDDDVSDDLSDAPVPDAARLARLAVGRRHDGVVEVWGPPTSVLSLARWLRAPTDAVIEVDGPRRDDVVEVVSQLRLGGEADAPDLPSVDLDGSVLRLAGSATGLAALAEACEVVGVGALDVRFAPVERRVGLTAEGPEAALAAGSVELRIASAYPLGS